MAYLRIEPRLIDEIRRRISLAELIGGTVALKPAGHELRGLCPFHSERTPSFYVIEAKQFWHCFGCGLHGDAIGWVMRTTQADFPEAVEYLMGRAGLRPDAAPLPNAREILRRPAAEMLEKERRGKIELGRQIWVAALPIAGTLAARYLAQTRHIRLQLPPSLRFCPSLRHPYLGRDFGWPRLPALVGAIQIEGEPSITGAHCTYLASDGRNKAPPPASWPANAEWKPKLMRGEARGGAVRLTRAEDVMILAEGIETALSLLQGLYDPDQGRAHIDGEPVGVWAALSQGNLGRVRLPAGVREVVLAADNDGKIPDAANPHQIDPAAIIDAAAARHAELGRNVRIARPPRGADFNDLVPVGSGYAGEQAEAGAP